MTAKTRSLTFAKKIRRLAGSPVATIRCVDKLVIMSQRCCVHQPRNRPRAIVTAGLAKEESGKAAASSRTARSDLQLVRIDTRDLKEAKALLEE